MKKKTQKSDFITDGNVGPTTDRNIKLLQENKIHKIIRSRRIKNGQSKKTVNYPKKKIRKDY